MKILHIPTGGLFADGILSSIMEYVSAMNCSDMRIDILATNNPQKEIVKKVQDLNCKVRIIPYRKERIFLYFLELCKLIKKQKYDIIHVHGSSSIMVIELFAGFVSGCKIRIAHSHNTTCENKKVHRLFIPFFYIMYTHAFACGNDAGKWLFGGRAYQVIPNGRNLSKYEYSIDSRKYWREELQIEDDSLIIGHVGRFNTQKNHSFIIQIFAELNKLHSNSKLILIGAGEKVDVIRQQVIDCNLDSDVIFLGSTDNVQELLSAMDIMLLPSLYEGLPIVVIEWQAVGLPCVISDVITDECIVTDNVKKMCLSKSAQEWAQMILEMELSDRMAERDSIKKKMRDAGFDIDYNASRLKELYCKYIKEVKK